MPETTITVCPLQIIISLTLSWLVDYSSIINDLKLGQALDNDGLSADHLQFCHPVLSVILAKLFNLLISCSYVPDGFRYIYSANT